MDHSKAKEETSFQYVMKKLYEFKKLDGNPIDKDEVCSFQNVLFKEMKIVIYSNEDENGNIESYTLYSHPMNENLKRCFDISLPLRSSHNLELFTDMISDMMEVIFKVFSRNLDILFEHGRQSSGYYDFDENNNLTNADYKFDKSKMNVQNFVEVLEKLLGFLYDCNFVRFYQYYKVISYDYFRYTSNPELTFHCREDFFLALRKAMLYIEKNKDSCRKVFEM